MSFFISTMLPIFLVFSLGVIIWVAFFVDLDKLAEGNNDIHRALVLAKRVAVTVSLLLMFSIVMGRYYLDTYYSQSGIDMETTEEELQERREQRDAHRTISSSINYRDREDDNSHIEARDRAFELTDWRNRKEE